MTAARHNALDRLRRERTLEGKLALLADHVVQRPGSPSGQERAAEADERLALLFGCCHPALSPEAQLALTLRAILGVTTAQIARATLEPESTVGQRISRAKKKMAAAAIPVRIPEGSERAERLDVVLAVIAVMYDAAHLASGAGAAADRDLAEDALWLARVVALSLTANEAERRLLLARLNR